MMEEEVMGKPLPPRDPETGRFIPDPEKQWVAMIRGAGICAGTVVICLVFYSAGHLAGYKEAEGKYLMAIEAAKPTPLMGAKPTESPWTPEPQPYYPPQPRAAEWIVTGEARRVQGGQVQLTIGFYPKDSGRGAIGDPLRLEEAEPTIIPQKDE